jgi:SanA protein
MIKFRKKIKLFIVIIFILAVITTLLLVVCNREIVSKSATSIYSNEDTIPYNKVGLLLGTSKYLSGRIPNPYFFYRISAAVVLYNAHKISFIVVSGDNRRLSYNEPKDMKNELIKNGIPDSVIFLDYAGFRTFDSVIRCNKVFGQDSFTVISQKFHLERAVYIAQYSHIKAIGFEAFDLGMLEGYKTRFREYFARVLVFWDLFTGGRPHFLGEKVVIQ